MYGAARTHSWSLASLLALAAAGIAWAWVSYDPVADGTLTVFLGAVVCAVGFALIAGGSLMDQRLRASVPIGVGACILAIGAVVPHAARLAFLTFGGTEITERFTPPIPGRWSIATVGGGGVDRGAGAVSLHAPPRGGAYLAVDGKDLQRDLSAARGPLRHLGIAPLARDRHESDESLRWRASYTREADYLTVVETDSVLVQVFGPGLLVQARSGPRAPLGDGAVVPRAADALATVRQFVVARSPGGTTLSIDDDIVWRGPRSPELGLIRVGEPRPGADHAGTVTIEWAVYERRPAADRVLLEAPWPAERDVLGHAAPLSASLLLLAAIVAVRRSRHTVPVA